MDNSQWDIIYDANGKAIGKKKKEADKGFFGNLISGIVDPFSRTIRDATTGLSKVFGNNQNFLTEQETKDLSNPLNKIKDYASIASTILPFGAAGKGIGAAMKAGAKAGAVSGFGQSYGKDSLEETLGDTLGGAAGGALFGAALPLAGKGMKSVANKVRPNAAAATNEISDLTGKLSRAFNKADDSFGKGKGWDNYKQRLRGAEVDVATGADTANPLLAKRQTQNIIDALGETQDVNGIVRGKEKLGNLMDAYVDDIYKKNPKVSLEGSDIFGKNFQDEIQSLAIGANANVNDINNFARNLIGQGRYGEFKDIVTKKYSVGDLKQILQDVNGALRNKDITGVRRLYANEVKKAIYDKMAELAPEYKNIARSYAILSSNEKATALKAMRGDQSASQSGLFGLQSVLPISQAKNKISRMAGGVLDKGVPFPKSQAISNKLEALSKKLETAGIPTTKAAQLTGAYSILKMFDTNGDGQISPDEQANAESYGVDTGGMSEKSSQRDQAYNMLITLTDPSGQQVYTPAEVKAILDEKFGPQQNAGDMTEKQKQFNSAATIAQQALDALETGKASTGKLATLGNMFSDFVGATNTNQTDYKAKLSAARGAALNALSGAAVSPSEYARLIGMMPEDTDEPKIAIQKLKSFIDSMKTYASGGL